MRVFALPSGEVVDVDNVLDAIIEAGWGVKNINCIVAFGSAARRAEYRVEKVTEYIFGFIPYNSERKIYTNPPKDIDILVMYNDEPAKEFEDLSVSHVTEYIGSCTDGYGVIGFRGFKNSKLHIIGTTVARFENLLQTKGGHFNAQSVRRDGIVLYGSNELFAQRYTVRNMSIAMTELVEATKEK